MEYKSESEREREGERERERERERALSVCTVCLECRDREGWGGCVCRFSREGPRVFFVNEAATTESYTLSLRDAEPIFTVHCWSSVWRPRGPGGQ